MTDGIPCQWPNRWQGHYVKFLDVIQNWLNNVADVLAHCVKDVNPVPHIYKKVIMSSILCIPLPLLSNLKGPMTMDINWTPTIGPIPCQLQSGPAYEPRCPLY